ncbi:MAG: glycosyltransferase family 2 protein [Pseudomonadota bacterium]|nr:glycosyltransferase family 2 protein [Pseudomonadota bacterium]
MIVLPARNEGPRVGRVVAEVRRLLPGVPVVVVENGSIDDTAAAAARAGAVVLRSGPGYARALRAGFLYALDAGAPWVVQMDADEQHPAAALPALLRALDHADLVVGSRFVGAPGYRVPVHRRTAIGALAALASVCAGQRLFDVTSGLRAWRPEALAALTDDYPEDIADANLLVRAVRRGLRVHEVSVPMRARSGGRSMHAGPASVLFALRMMVLTAREGLGPRRLLLGGSPATARPAPLEFSHRSLP